MFQRSHFQMSLKPPQGVLPYKVAAIKVLAINPKFSLKKGMNETEKFLEESGENKKVDIMDMPLDASAQETEVTAAKEEEGEETTTTETEVEDPEKQPDEVKNRRHKRLEARLQAERESNIRLTERMLAIAEAKKDNGEEAGFLKGIERIYGTDSPEAIAATELLKSSLLGLHESAKKSAIDEIRNERIKEIEEQKKADAELDSMIEEIEDEYSVDLSSTGSERTRKGFFSMLQKMSPKDEHGNITQFADHHAVWEAFQSQVKSKKQPENRAKDLASRSGTQSGAAAGAKTQDDAATKWLKENGII